MPKLLDKYEELIGQPFVGLHWTYPDVPVLDFGDVKDVRKVKRGENEFEITRYAYSLHVHGNLTLRATVTPAPPLLHLREDVRLPDYEKDAATAVARVLATMKVRSSWVYLVHDPRGFELRLILGSENPYEITITPAPDPEGTGVPDWKLFTPEGLLEVGPGYAMRFTPTS